MTGTRIALLSYQEVWVSRENELHARQACPMSISQAGVTFFGFIPLIYAHMDFDGCMHDTSV